MKQFIQKDERTKYVILALNDRAFVGTCTDYCSDHSKYDTIYELLPPITVSSSSSFQCEAVVEQQQQQEVESNNDNSNVLNQSKEENTSTAIGTTTTTSTSTINPLEIQAVAIVSVPEMIPSSSSYSSSSPPILTSSTTTTTATTIWCAVTRHDKSLAIYQFLDRSSTTNTKQQDPNNNNDSTKTTHGRIATHKHVDNISSSTKTVVPIRPVMVYRTNKRAGSLCFAFVNNNIQQQQEQQYQQQQQQPKTSTSFLPVVIAGDLAGDAVAFRLVSKTNERKDTDTSTITSTAIEAKNEMENVLLLNSPTDHKTSDDDDKNDLNLVKDLNQMESSDYDHQVASLNQRLLLGHTASMLTSVHVVGVSSSSDSSSLSSLSLSNSYMITSDRDEKIRVSCFPQTEKIIGYLLGHTSYISCTDYVVVNDDDYHRPWCVSISGDQTIRLWNYHTCTLLATTSFCKKQPNQLSQQQQVQVVAGEEEDGDEDDEDILGSEEEEEDDVEEENDDEGIEQDGKIEMIPSRVAMNANGNLIVSIYEDCHRFDLWRTVVESTTTINKKSHDNDDLDTEKNSEKKVEIQFVNQQVVRSQPMGITFLGEHTLLVLTRQPDYMIVYDINMEMEGGATLILDVTKNVPFVRHIRYIALQASIQLPISLMERDTTQITNPNSSTNKLKLQKLNETRGGSRTLPWNNSHRKNIAKERTKRFRKRKRIQQQEQEQEQEQEQQDDAE